MGKQGVIQVFVQRDLCRLRAKHGKGMVDRDGSSRQPPAGAPADLNTESTPLHPPRRRDFFCLIAFCWSLKKRLKTGICAVQIAFHACVLVERTK